MSNIVFESKFHHKSMIDTSVRSLVGFSFPFFFFYFYLILLQLLSLALLHISRTNAKHGNARKPDGSVISELKNLRN